MEEDWDSETGFSPITNPQPWQKEEPRTNFVKTETFQRSRGRGFWNNPSDRDNDWRGHGDRRNREGGRGGRGRGFNNDFGSNYNRRTANSQECEEDYRRDRKFDKDSGDSRSSRRHGENNHRNDRDSGTSMEITIPSGDVGRVIG